MSRLHQQMKLMFSWDITGLQIQNLLCLFEFCGTFLSITSHPYKRPSTDHEP